MLISFPTVNIHIASYLLRMLSILSSQLSPIGISRASDITPLKNPSLTYLVWIIGVFLIPVLNLNTLYCEDLFSCLLKSRDYVIYLAFLGTQWLISKCLLNVSLNEWIPFYFKAALDIHFIPNWYYQHEWYKQWGLLPPFHRWDSQKGHGQMIMGSCPLFI